MERDSRANGARYFYREFPSVGADYSIEKELEILIEMFIRIRKKKKRNNNSIYSARAVEIF